MSDIIPSRREWLADGLVAEWFPAELLSQVAWQTTMPNETPEERLRVLEVIEADAIKGRSMAGKVFEIRDYVCHPCRMTIEETGEIAIGCRTVFPQPDGPPIGFVSMGILQSLGRIVEALKRQPPFDPPLKVTLKISSGRGPRIVYKLVPVME